MYLNTYLSTAPKTSRPNKGSVRCSTCWATLVRRGYFSIKRNRGADSTVTATEEPTAVTTDAPVNTTAEPEDTTASAAPQAAATTLGFCMKFVTPDVGNYNYHVLAISPLSNQITEAPTGSNFGLYNIDMSTGRVTLDNTDYTGYELYTPPSFANQIQRVIRFTNTLPVPDYPFRCINPEGLYTSGSILKCSVTAPWKDGVPRTYDAWWASESTPVLAFSIWLAGYVPNGFCASDVRCSLGKIARLLRCHLGAGWTRCVQDMSGFGRRVTIT